MKLFNIAKNYDLSAKSALLAFCLSLVFAVALPQTASAQSPSHSYINTIRASNLTHYYVGIGVDGEFGTFKINSKEDDKAEESSGSRPWQGYGVRNEIGIEFLKFLQFNVAHTSLNLRDKEDSRQRLNGSRFEGGARLNFYAPLGNLQLGGGVSMLRLDYVNKDATSDFYGSGFYYTGGYDYFLSSNISFFAHVRRNQETLVRNAGSDIIKNMKTSTTGAGLGFNIWL